MICFVSPNPDLVEKKEGYMQRVSSIDDIFSGEDRVYLLDIESDVDRYRTMLEADIIYVHSLYQAEKIIDFYKVFGDKIITDLHGVVPEEEGFIGNISRCLELSNVESVVFKYCKQFVSVSRKMTQYYINKYKLSDDYKWVVLPIFSINSKVKYSHKKSNCHQIIYAGGMQKWQNPQLIADAIKKKAN